ncbi:MAG: helix-turn-helix domain-containing protein [Clostridia bacterium]|nr:helix-turn-helix domain-containing protein [Clostridia bacterium]
MKFNKEYFLSNMEYFLKATNIKASILEEYAGLSKGYYSRLRKPENKSIPGIDFLLAAATSFGISVEALSTINYATCSKNEKYCLHLLDYLISKTESDDLHWKSDSLTDFINKIEIKCDEETIVDNLPSPFSIITGISDRKTYKSPFKYGVYDYQKTWGDFYSLKLDDHNTIYIVKVVLNDGEKDFFGTEIFMITDYEKKSKVCCISPELPQAYDSYINKLYNVVKSSISANTVDENAKAAIDCFIND